LDSYKEPLVAKLPRQYASQDGLKQNIEEIDLWENAPDWFREFLVPVESAHPRGYWLLMRYAPEVQEKAEIKERRRYLYSCNLCSNELAPQNWGRWRGDVRLIDYGLNIAHRFPDTEIRNWVDIYDEDHRARHPEEYSDEEEEATSEDDENSPERDGPAAIRVSATAAVKPHQKSDLRSALRGKSVQAGEPVEVEIEEETIEVEIERTEPRSDRSIRDVWVEIDDETLFSF
jgi:hypothetical protein